MKISISFVLICIVPAYSLFGQIKLSDRHEQELVRLHSKTFSFYYSNNDSLNHYSSLFTNQLTHLIQSDTSTLTYPFKRLKDSNACKIATSIDGNFRIYSWDTWLGGTMHDFRNIYQFKSSGKIYTTTLQDGDSLGSLKSEIFAIQKNLQSCYLVISNESESSKYSYQSIQAYTIDNNVLKTDNTLIKTPSGLTNKIGFEFDFFSVAGRPERPVKLITYDSETKTIYIPVVLKNGKVTKSFIRYKFNGEYFEKTTVSK